MSFGQIRKIAHRSVAGVMAIWLSGIVLVFCCDVRGGQASHGSCPLAKMSHHCDKAKQASTSAFAFDGMGRCELLPAVFDKSRKVEQIEKQSAATPALAVVRFSLPLVRHVSVSPIPTLVYVPDRQGSFIRNRVLRI